MFALQGAFVSVPLSLFPRHTPSSDAARALSLCARPPKHQRLARRPAAAPVDAARAPAVALDEQKDSVGRVAFLPSHRIDPRTRKSARAPQARPTDPLPSPSARTRKHLNPPSPTPAPQSPLRKHNTTTAPASSTATPHRAAAARTTSARRPLAAPIARPPLRRAPAVVVRADSRDSGFTAGFILGGVVFGALGFLFAPQISRALLGEDDRLRLPRVLADADAASSAPRDPEAAKQDLIDKIAQLNASIDEVASQLRQKEDTAGGGGGGNGSNPVAAAVERANAAVEQALG